MYLHPPAKETKDAVEPIGLEKCHRIGDVFGFILRRKSVPTHVSTDLHLPFRS